ncbi:hypothetical protein HK100_001926 [Physocladia obscura]|uniref:PH domain-containing protein n=1 Tax=Physocladia obscura TaxID=109957 RepID=A0AAD5XEJ6_9FUNG|nr:hypothetical protein HK100_001926 [Physocladia obscura]
MSQRSKSIPRTAQDFTVIRSKSPVEFIAPAPLNLNVARKASHASPSSAAAEIDATPSISRHSSITSSIKNKRGSDSSNSPSETTVARVSALSLSHLQKSQLTLPAHLQKLNAVSQTWERRFFVLSEDAKIYMYHDDADPNSSPIAILPVEGYVPTTGLDTPQTLTLNVFGECAVADGSLAMVQWTLQFPDEASKFLWVQSISRVLDERGSTKLELLMERTLSADSNVKNRGAGHYVAPEHTTLSRSRSLGTKNLPQSFSSPSSFVSNFSSSVGFENRAALMHQRYQEYMSSQKEIQKKMMSPEAIKQRQKVAAEIAAEHKRLAREHAEWEILQQKKALLAKADSMRNALGI